MAWSISMSPEGWDLIRRNLEQLTHEQLVQAIADDRFEEVFETEGIDAAEAASEATKRQLNTLPHDVLVDHALELIGLNNTCDNGGFTVWIDREGCHTVSAG